ncbi:hypothetical protein GGR20_003734 [Devosia subaequoris]|uniref:DUF2946 domain-containing protein n=1 Tax=Devosia subaequoris TaxID=395930 RepID=A0A7W6NDI6_9HYPH|nr:hypothetical protein [Devosia subaequoris]MBB4054058.1 hypothetical protein [Devosia subaequoris]
MKLIVRILLTLLMALTLNASMVFAATTHSPFHRTAVSAQPCDHHGHGPEKASHANVVNGEDCTQQVCPSCTGLLLSAPVMPDSTLHFGAEPFTLDSWSASWRPLLFRPPIHI